MAGLVKKDNISFRQRLLSFSVVLVCACIVLAMRFGFLPAGFRVNGSMIPVSDLFIILCAGLCGHRYGLGMFLLIFITEVVFRGDDIIQLFPLFLYLIEALSASALSEGKWFQSKKMTILAGIILELQIGGTLYLVFTIIYAYSEDGIWKCLLCSLPETAVVIFFLYAYFQYVPDSIKGSFGIGRAYIENQDIKSAKKDRTARFITLLSLAEGIIAGIVSVVLSGKMIAYLVSFWGLSEPDDGTVFKILIITFFYAMAICLSVAFIFNEFIVSIVRRIVGLQLRLENELTVSEAESAAKSTFLSSMSHEIRTPINTVLGMDEMILRDTREDQTYEYAQNIKVAGNTLLGLVNDVLDFSKIEAGKMSILPVEYETASVIHDLVTMVSLRAQEKGLVLETSIDTDLPSVLYGDEIRIKQVVTNILTNAVKYTDEGGITFSIGCRKENDDTVRLLISVKDTGIGIRSEDLDKLFSAFDRIEEERNRNIEGTGLGMSITTRLLELMGSHLSVSSVYGEGSDFSFELVQKVISWEIIGNYEEKWKATVRVNKIQNRGFTAPEARVLAVDDMPMNLTVLTGLLKPTQMQIDTAMSGEECIEKLNERKYDLIFLDHRMPGMDGVETLARVKELGLAAPNVPVIALTANAISGAREEYLGYGFSDYMTKPVSFSSLSAMCLKYLPDEIVKEASAPGNSGNAIPQDNREIPVIDGLDIDYARLHIPDTELLHTAIIDFYKAAPVHANKLGGYYGNIRINRLLPTIGSLFME